MSATTPIAQTYSSAFEHALGYANTVHHGQIRKGSGIPYITHLLAVAAIVAENGGDEEQVIAGLLHDAVEDQGGMAMHANIVHWFGPRVGRIVLDCSDHIAKQGEPKLQWRQRKELYIAHTKTAPVDSQLVSLADKVHNARCTYADLIERGPVVWETFAGKRTGMLWYWNGLLEAYLTGTVSPALRGEFMGLIDRLSDYGQD